MCREGHPLFPRICLSRHLHSPLQRQSCRLLFFWDLVRGLSTAVELHLVWFGSILVRFGSSSFESSPAWRTNFLFCFNWLKFRASLVVAEQLSLEMTFCSWTQWQCVVSSLNGKSLSLAFCRKSESWWIERWSHRGRPSQFVLLWKKKCEWVVRDPIVAF